MRILLIALACALILSGCASKPTDTTTSATKAAPIQHAPAEPLAAEETAKGEIRKTILGQDFAIDSAQPGSAIAVQVPANASRVLLTMDYKLGAFQDAGFTLGACHHVSTDTGTAIYSPTGETHIGGTISHGHIFDCGPIAAGAASITWSLTGHAEGRITAYADVPK